MKSFMSVRNVYFWVILGLITPPSSNAFSNNPLIYGASLRSRSMPLQSSSPSSTSSSSLSKSSDIPANVILYDGVCNFCNTWVDLLLRVDFQQKFKFAPLQSSTGQKLLVSIGKEADDISSVVLVQQDGSYYDKSQCVLKVVEELGPGADLLARAARQVVPQGFRDDIYDMVAENRYNLMGKREECRCSDPTYADRFLLD